jgi:hypothetical protein
MNRQTVLSVSLAISSLAFLSTLPVAALSPQQAAPAPNAEPIPAGAQSEAAQMVPATAVLVNTLDAAKAKPGDQFKATLRNTVHLKDGTELKHGTVLIGEVTTDDMQKTGTSSLALRFTQAQMKGHSAIPITATIINVGVPEGTGPAADYASETLSPWDGVTLQVDEPKAVKGADLHSRIAGRNSGVFIANNRDNVKLGSQSQLILALGPGNSNSADPNGGN